jgi:RNA polymerase sigma-70 factor (ECF subfamily)
MMRRILIDYARRRGYAKRGGGAPHVSLEEAAVLTEERAANLIALDDALNSLAALDPQQCRVVELKFFGGLTTEETAEVLGLSVDKVKREWSTAKLWLFRKLSKS